MSRLAIAALALLSACGASTPATRSASMDDAVRFGDDLAFLRAHVPDTIVLARGDARVAIAPGYQGRVMTSSARGDAGASCGWIHRSAIASGERAPHMNAFGGEDRFWLGPEGGQYGLYFAPGVPFDLEHWQVPEPIDWGGWDATAQSDTSVSFRRDMQLVNASGTPFSLRVDRTLQLLDDANASALIEGRTDVSVVAYESINQITNMGDAAWTQHTGLVSIWILSMYPGVGTIIARFAHACRIPKRNVAVSR